MNQLDFEQLLAAGPQRRLTPLEQQALEAWLAAHPEARRAWHEALALEEALRTLPDAPLAPQFTARVLAEVEREAPVPSRRGGFSLGQVRGWLSRWRAAMAGIAVLLLAVGLSWHQQVRQRARLAESVAAMAALAELPDLEALAEFEVVYHLPTGPLPDVQELARAFE